MKKDFNQWLSQFKESIANYGYYIDFETVYKNISDIKVELNIMNSLVGSPSIEEDFKELVKKYPSVLKCIPILLAKREMSIFCMDQDGTFNYNFNKQNYSIDEYVIFMKKTGLFELIQKRLISNLYDYVLGVEADGGFSRIIYYKSWFYKG
jgi:type II restriction enzyme